MGGDDSFTSDHRRPDAARVLSFLGANQSKARQGNRFRYLEPSLAFVDDRYRGTNLSNYQGDQDKLSSLAVC
jgi:hypothetical protein